MMVELGRPVRQDSATDTSEPGCEATPAAALDATALAKLRDLDPGGTQGVVPRVLAAYERSLLRLLDELAAARAGGELDRIGRVAHTLKSSSASIGALALSRICAEVELAARGEGSPPADATLDALVHEARAAVAAVRAMLGR